MEVDSIHIVPVVPIQLSLPSQSNVTTTALTKLQSISQNYHIPRAVIELKLIHKKYTTNQQIFKYLEAFFNFQTKVVFLENYFINLGELKSPDPEKTHIHQIVRYLDGWHLAIQNKQINKLTSFEKYLLDRLKQKIERLQQDYEKIPSSDPNHKSKRLNRSKNQLEIAQEIYAETLGNPSKATYINKIYSLDNTLFDSPIPFSLDYEGMEYVLKIAVDYRNEEWIIEHAKLLTAKFYDQVKIKYAKDLNFALSKVQFIALIIALKYSDEQSIWISDFIKTYFPWLTKTYSLTLPVLRGMEIFFLKTIDWDVHFQPKSFYQYLRNKYDAGFVMQGIPKEITFEEFQKPKLDRLWTRAKIKQACAEINIVKLYGRLPTDRHLQEIVKIYSDAIDDETHVYKAFTDLKRHTKVSRTELIQINCEINTLLDKKDVVLEQEKALLEQTDKIFKIFDLSATDPERKAVMLSRIKYLNHSFTVLEFDATQINAFLNLKLYQKEIIKKKMISQTQHEPEKI